MRTILLSTSCLFLFHLCGCVEDPTPPKAQDASLDANSPEDFGTDTGSDGGICIGSPAMLMTFPAPTFPCNAEIDGTAQCTGGCGWLCQNSCWITVCDGPCGGLDLGT